MLLGMNQHRLHPEESLSPQKLTISGVNFASPLLAFLNTNNVIALSELNIPFEKIGLLNASLPNLLNKSYKLLSCLVLSSSITFVIAFEMKVRRKIKQVSIYLNEPQLGLLKAINYINAKFAIPALLAVYPPRQIWGVMSLYMVRKSWTVQNVFSYFLFAQWVIKTTSYYLLSLSSLYPNNLGWSNTKEKIAFPKKVALLVKNLQFTGLLTIFNQQGKVQILLSL